MGFSISWIAVRGLSKSEVCRRLAILDTGEPDEANESPISGAALPNNWQVIFLNDLMHPFVTVESLNLLSKDCEVVGCQVEEHVMVCAAFFYANGARVWNITHESDKGITNLDAEGLLPAAFDEIRTRNLAAQQKDDAEDGGVDYVFEIPLELAEHVCGYKHDRWQFEWGEPTFTKYVPAPR